MKSKTSFLGILKASFLEPPQHLDGVDQADVGVVEIVEGAESEGREEPNASLCNSGDERLAVE